VPVLPEAEILRLTGLDKGERRKIAERVSILKIVLFPRVLFLDFCLCVPESLTPALSNLAAGR
jgi:hypothetical protein